MGSDLFYEYHIVNFYDPLYNTAKLRHFLSQDDAEKT